ncbi:MAG: Tol biopolymer transporter periplasmic protein [Oscillatoriales cyanobacterium RM2_1_1]|nr:Tol biopolymer transporter periplasmic protein [Oscillatoriales cyanobacterium SM2_3_0]NJO46978.1 Tol biopolymer transporter periplasmic protein [Oscillatoriales cyanobacterium RM2_1_1]
MLGLVTGCGGYPRLVNYPFGNNISSLNSSLTELTPQITRQYLIFVSDRQQHQDIYLYDLGARSLLDTPELNALDVVPADPVISANGLYIAFVALRGGQSNIYLYNRKTHQLRNLTQSLLAQVRHPTLSADGSIIAFESSANGQWDILIYNRYGQPLDFNPIPD